MHPKWRLIGKDGVNKSESQQCRSCHLIKERSIKMVLIAEETSVIQRFTYTATVNHPTMQMNATHRNSTILRTLPRFPVNDSSYPSPLPCQRFFVPFPVSLSTILRSLPRFPVNDSSYPSPFPCQRFFVPFPASLSTILHTLPRFPVNDSSSY